MLFGERVMVSLLWALKDDLKLLLGGEGWGSGRRRTSLHHHLGRSPVDILLKSCPGHNDGSVVCDGDLVDGLKVDLS